MDGQKKIVLVDCGVKNNIIRSLIRRDCQVVRVPYDYDFFQLEFDAVVISNGPGDPKMFRETIDNVKKCIKSNIPTLGICLGNQILALSAGANTYKLKYGHRSQNQPSLRVGTKRCYITSQNHGYAVETKTLPKGWTPPSGFRMSMMGLTKESAIKPNLVCQSNFIPSIRPVP